MFSKDSKKASSFDACPLLSEGVDCWVRSILDMLVKERKYVAFDD